MGTGGVSKNPRGTALFLAAGLLVGYAYFYQGGDWNQNSRFALVRAIVERGTVQIDDTGRWQGELVTGDLARRGTHLYSDKAPGLALTAVPVVAVARLLTPASKAGLATLAYVATVATAAVPTVLAACLLFWLALQLGSSAGGAAFAAATFGLGTPAWCYATLLFGHALATGCLVAAFAAAVALATPGSARRDALYAAGLGLTAGWATVTEYPCAIPAVLIAGLALASTWLGGAARWRRVVAGVAGGAAVCVVVLMIYNQAAFGAPLGVSYAHVEGLEGFKQGFLGVTYPKVRVLGWLLFGRFRGLFYLAPALALAPAGFALLVRAHTSRRAGLTAAAIVVYFVLFNASYFYWHGAWSYGPRYLAPALPFFCLALAPLWTRAPWALRAPLAALALYGVVLSLVAVSTTALPSKEDYEQPVGQLLWPSFRRGELALHHQAIVEFSVSKARDPSAHAWNAGEKLGLSGKTSLLPLFAAWGVLGGVWWWTTRPWRQRSGRDKQVMLCPSCRV